MNLVISAIDPRQSSVFFRSHAQFHSEQWHSYFGGMIEKLKEPEPNCGITNDRTVYGNRTQCQLQLTRSKDFKLQNEDNVTTK